MASMKNILTEEFLTREYVEKGRFAKEIALEVGCSQATVGKYLKKYEIETKNRYDKRPKFKGLNPVRLILTKEYLELEYLTKGRSMTNIARELYCSPSLVREMIIKHGLSVDKAQNRSFYGEDNELTGKYVSEDNGYLVVRLPNHPKANCRGYVRLHVLLAEYYFDKEVQENEVVHHKNENKYDNQKENLQIMTKKEHDTYHTTKRWNEGNFR